MKILNVVSVFFSIPSFFGKQINHFHSKGYEIHIICSPSKELSAYSIENRFKFKEVELSRRFSIINDLFAVINVYRYIKQNKIDIVTGHTVKGSFISMIASFIAGVSKRVYFRHGFYFENLKGLKRVLLMNIDRFTSLLSTHVVCVSPFVYEKSISWSLTTEKKLLIINNGSCNGVDSAIQFNPSILKKDYLEKIKNKIGIKYNNFIIGYTGRIVRDKGIEELVDAYKLVKEKYSNIILLLVGPFEIRDCISLRIKKIIAMDNQIITTGLVSKNIEYYYSLMDLFILPTYREGLGTSILEASAMKLPVLTTSHSGSRDAICHNITGMYIELTVKSIFENISIYIESEKVRLEHGANGREFIVNNFSHEIVWNDLEKNIYK
ncbi:MAG: glycosyltransferase family 4 protein [Pelagibacterales bacterium]|nr:glycosyltransferase family 4 protein [Pelagibacterales bacterium]